MLICFSKKKQQDNDEEEEDSSELVTYEDNHIYFYDDVNTKSILLLIKYIKAINQKFAMLKSELTIKYETNIAFNIYLHINSGGGYITDAFAAIDYIRLSAMPVVSIVEGFAASAATLISVVCHKRQITKMSSMLIHQLSSEANGTYEQLEDDHENNKYLEECIKKIYIVHTHNKLNNKILQKILKHDIMWNAAKCLQYNLVDEII